jgi:hypothetical protein
MFGLLNHLKITYVQLLLYGVHIGHSLSNTLLYSSWLIYGVVKNLTLIICIKLYFYDVSVLKEFH